MEGQFLFATTLFGWNRSNRSLFATQFSDVALYNMIKQKSLFSLLALLILATTTYQAPLPCSAAGQSSTAVERSLVIKASAKTVFEGIQSSRTDDPMRRHMISHNQDVAVIDEKIPNLPVIGNAHLIYKEIEVPFKRIDYLLVSSDKFKVFEGSWELIPLDNGRSTKVVLKSFSEIKIWTPFAKELSASSAVKDINRRLANLKHFCEESDVRQAQAAPDGERISTSIVGHSHDYNRLAENTVPAQSHIDIAGNNRP